MSAPGSPVELYDPIVNSSRAAQAQPRPQSAETAQPTPSINERIKGLDELRGIAILFVLVAHFFSLRSLGGAFEDFHLGGVGVDPFFVVSGYLIGKILLNTKGRDGFFRTFYVRRAFRILPLFTIVASAAILFAFLTKSEAVSSWFFYATFTQNLIPEAEQVGDIVSPTFQPIVGLSPLWSLSVEEHFYIVLPAIVATFPKRWLPVILTTFATIGIAADTYIVRDVAESWFAYSNPHETWFNMHYLAAGALMNFTNYHRYLAGLLSLWATILVVLNAQFVWLQVGIAVLIFVAVAGAIEGWLRIKSAPLAKTGILVYGLYVLHIPILIVLRKVEESAPWIPEPALFLVFVMSTFVAAQLSFTYIESPAQRLRTRFE